MISMEECNRLKRRDRQVLELGDFTDADISAWSKPERRSRQRCSMTS